MGFSEYSVMPFGEQAPENSAGSPSSPSPYPHISQASLLNSPRVRYWTGEENLCFAKAEENEVGRWFGSWAPASWAWEGSCGGPAWVGGLILTAEFSSPCGKS